MVVSGSSYIHGFHVIRLKKDTLHAHSSNGIEICVFFISNLKSNLCIAKGKVDIVSLQL
jgi:hypothetical protein